MDGSVQILKSLGLGLLESYGVAAHPIEGPAVGAVWEEMLVSMLEQHEELLVTDTSDDFRGQIQEFLRERATVRAGGQRLFAWSWFVRLEYAIAENRQVSVETDRWTAVDWESYETGREIAERVYRHLEQVRIHKPFFLLCEEELDMMAWVAPPAGGLSLSVLREFPLIDTYLVDPSMQWCVTKTHEPDCGPYLLRNYSRCSFL